MNCFQNLKINKMSKVKTIALVCAIIGVLVLGYFAFYWMYQAYQERNYSILYCETNNKMTDLTNKAFDYVGQFANQSFTDISNLNCPKMYSAPFPFYKVITLDEIINSTEN